MAEETAKAEAPAPAPSSGGGGGGGKLVLILTGVNLMATLGIVAVLVISFQKEAQKPGIEDMVAHDSHGGGDGHGAAADAHGGGGGHGAEGSSQFAKMVQLDLFTVNLSTVGSVNPKYARVNISLEVPNKDVEDELSQKKPQVRNIIIDLFNAKKPADLADTQGRNYLKEEILNALNQVLQTGQVKGVFFTSFAVSS